MDRDPVEKLVKIGFSKYEARAYVALLTKNPVTGYGLAKRSGVPRSMIYRVADQLVTRGAAVTLPMGDSIQYAPIPAAEFLDRLRREYGEIIASLKDDLEMSIPAAEAGRVWNIKGNANVMARAAAIVDRARERVYLGILPTAFPALQPALEEAIERGVRVVIYTTTHLVLPGSRVVIAPIPEDTLEDECSLSLILIRDGKEALIGERLDTAQAQASWTENPALVSIAEHHLVRGGRRRFLVSVE